MAGQWNSVSETLKGVLLIFVGTLLLLYSLGILTQSLTAIIVLISVGLIGYGLVISGAYAFLRRMTRSKSE